jgi:ComF family protein
MIQLKGNSKAQYVKALWEDFVSIIFPIVCVNCQEVLLKNEEIICTSCTLDLPYTDYHKLKENPIYQRLVSLHKLTFATAYLFFYKQGIAQKLLHGLKYKGRKDIGKFLGIKCGNALIGNLSIFDTIISVPIHQKKIKTRGYNQSDIIAAGISEATGIPFDQALVKRNVQTQSQTKMNKVGRWKNVENIYSISDLGKVKGKNIVIVDDIITTGATITLLAELLQSNEVNQLAIVCIATGR